MCAMKCFRTTSAPSGWTLGEWRQASPTEWEEKKVDGTSYAFEILEASNTPGSETVRLRMKGASTEVLLLDKTVQIFVDGHYFGEYRGQWEINGKPVAPAVSAVGSRGLPGGGAGGGAAARAGNVQSREIDFGGGVVVTNIEEAESALQGVARGKQKVMGLDTSPAGGQALQDAVKIPSADAVKRVLQTVDVDALGKDGKTGLLTLCEKVEAGKIKMEVAEVLLEAGADVSIAKDEVSPLTVAFQKGDTKLLRLLMREAFSAMQAKTPQDLGIDMSAIGGVDSADNWDGLGQTQAMDRLRVTTSELSKLNTEAKGTHEVDLGEHTGMFDETLKDTQSSDMMREESVREKMRDLIKSSKMEGQLVQEQTA